MINSNTIAYKVYTFLTTKISNLPPFSYQVAIDTNNSFIFTAINEKPKDYFSKTETYSYTIRLYLSKYEHATQLKMCEKIIKALTSVDFKTLNYDDKTTSLIFINSLPNPDYNDIIFNLETYNDTTQCYQLDLTVLLNKKG